VLHAIEWILFGAASVTAVIVGVKRHQPARTGPWLLLGCAVAGMSLGDAFYAFAWFTVADLFYLSMFFSVALAMMQLTRGGALLRDRARLIDLLSCACSTLLVVWVYILGGDGEIGEISAANVIGSLLLLGVAARLVAAAWFNWSAILLLTGSVGMLISDAVYPLFPGPAAETGYIVLYLAWGAAALHPSMVRLTMPMPERTAPWRGHWAILLGLSVATPPAVLLIEALSGTVEDGVVIAVAGGLTLVMTITRLADSVSLNSKALTRERVLREASTALVAASDQASVDEAVRSAVRQLLPPRVVERVVFTTDDRQLTAQSLPAAPADPRPRSWWLDDKAKKHDPGTGDATLVCPLWLEPLAVARPSGGALVLSGRRDMLTANRDALEVLAGQAALALDRISLVEAVGRRDSDLYLRAVIRNTADIMLVIDEDQQIRYASPALRALIGQEDLPPFATLQDLVHPDDRSQVRSALRDQGDGVVYCSLQRADQTQVYIEATYRDLREDRLVQGFVVTMRDVTTAHDPVEQVPHLEHVDALPAWVNRRSAQHKFRY
jgi:PAS domain S-box-containing protein